MSIPEIRKDGGFATLYVNDEPFFCLAGELHNSASSSLDYMSEKVWPALKGLNMNSVIAPIYWEQIERVEGTYDFSLLDGLIGQARENDIKLILLWFGLWKNAESMYVPGWMKEDSKTYFRAQKASGEKINTISPLCDAAIAKDEKCFAAILKHLKEVDEKENTVIAIQVENEIGILGDYRDYCDAANSAFEAEMPKEMTDLTGRMGSWKDALKDNAEEAFMAYHFAKAVGRISKAGQAEYNLPMYANAWLRQYPWVPGTYPSGGPVAHGKGGTAIHAIWKTMAPNLFTLAPDIYVPYVAEIMDEYAYPENPLFIPEVRKDAVASSYCLYAFGKHNAICFSPFGIEELALDPSEVDQPPMAVMIALNIDPSAFDTRGSFGYLSQTYRMITEMKPLMMKYRGTSHQQAYCRHGENDYGTFLKFNEYDLQVAYAPRESGKPLGAGIVFELADNDFIIAGTRSTFTFKTKPGETAKIEILDLETGDIENGEWKCSRVLNGDEKMTLQLGDMPGYIHVKLFKY